MTQAEANVLAINGGSSSIKFALYRMGESPQRRLHGSVDRIGLAGTASAFSDDVRNAEERRDIGEVDRGMAADIVIDWLERSAGLQSIDVVGHRVAHGGSRHVEPQFVSDDLLGALRGISGYAPEHLPAEIALIDRFSERLPRLPQVACFDTAFHRTMPDVARTLAIPARLRAGGVERYGFHGLSYAYLMEALAREAGAEAARGRIVLAHLGNGASLAAVHGGRSVDTSMAFTPAAGVPMSTRSGDIDPGLVLYLAQTEGMTPQAFNDMVNHQSGLLGVSETSGDVRDLLEREAHDPRAALALALFCYHVKKRIGAFAAALGGVDSIVFAGGIGENAPAIRARIFAGLEFLGVDLDPGRNARNAALISSPSSRVGVRVIHTNEEVMIARAAASVLAAANANAGRA